MRFVENINKKKFTLISIFLFLYVSINLFDGDRGLISYYEKKQKIDLLTQQKEIFTERLNEVEKKNSLLTETIDTDYLEILYRKMFIVGKVNEKMYVE